jgi:hypothetical protein
VTLMQDGVTLTFSCHNPQPYTTMDQSSSGWACFDPNSGRWSLNAMPPASATLNAIPPSCAILNAMPPSCANVHTKRRHDHAPPSDHYNYAYPDYTYYPEGFFGGRTH